MRKKIAFIGAGSFGFTRGLVRDLLTFPAFQDAEIALMDINAERLEAIRQACEKLKTAGKYGCEITATMNRAEALQGADGVVITILCGETDVWKYDIEIPKKYGVDINVGDTRGPAGIFRFLRTAPEMLRICDDVAKYCPDAFILNYTNPMAMLCRIMQGTNKVNVTGLCHSVQGTAEMLAKWIGAPMDEITYTCAGINHTAFYTEFKWNGKDAYPLIRKAITGNKEIYNEEIVRNEMFLMLDYYVTESSGHNSEYNAWFRKRPDLIEKFCIHGTGWNPGAYAYILKEYQARETSWKDDIKSWLADPEVDLKRGHEYAAYIFNALFGDCTPFEFNGNVQNFGSITNLPYDACVEIPVYATKGTLRKSQMGALPPQLALCSGVSAQIEEMAVQAALTGDKKLIEQAISFDPLTSAVLGLQEIKAMVNEMFEQNKDFLPHFFK